MTLSADPALRLLDELARADEAHAATIAELDELAAGASALRERADELAALLASAPAERARLEKALAEAELEEERCRVALVAAEAELAEAARRDDEERLLEARRVAVRARDALGMAEKRVRALASGRDEHERRVAAAQAEAPKLDEKAAALAQSLRGRPRVASTAGQVPRPGLAEVAEWASVACAALLVARSAAIAERDGVVRQANELGSAILGEALVASSVAAVADRVGEALAG